MKNGKIRTVIDEKIVPLAEEKKRYGENFLAVKLEMLHDLAIPNEKLCYAIKHLAKHNIAVTGLDEEVFCDTDSYKIVSEYNMYISKYSDENMVKNLQEYSETGSEELKKKMIEEMVPLVKWWLLPMAYEYSLPIDEVVNYSYEAMLNVIENFDFKRGTSFANYASRAVTRQAKREIDIEYGDRDRFFQIPSEMEDENFKLDEIAEYLDLVEKIEMLKSCLNERELRVLEVWFKWDTFDEMAKDFNVTRRKMIFLVSHLFKKVRSSSVSRKLRLKEFL